MRQFKLQDENGNAFNLMRKDAFFHMPSGLGFAVDVTFENIGNSFIATGEKPVQKVISGEMAFRSYSQYREFMSFISGKVLRLAYKPLDTWHYLNVMITNLEKTELTPLLICAIDFTAFSTWYTTSSVETTTIDLSTGKIYPYAYSYTYTDNTISSVVVENKSGLRAPLKLHIFGPCTNPHWSLIRNGVTVAGGEVTAIIPNGNKLVISSEPAALEIAEYTVSNVFVANRYSSSDFSTARFIHAPAGTSIISITHDGSGDIRMVVEVAQLADSV